MDDVRHFAVARFAKGFGKATAGVRLQAEPGSVAGSAPPERVVAPGNPPRREFVVQAAKAPFSRPPPALRRSRGGRDNTFCTPGDLRRNPSG